MKKKIKFVTTITFFVILSVLFADAQIKQNMFNFEHFMHINGKSVELKDTFINRNKVYIALREFCEKAGFDIKWVDPKFHQSPVPGGNLPSGISINIPSYVYVKEITDYNDTNKKIKGVDITGIYTKFKEGQNLKYYFSDSGLVIENNNEKKLLELNYHPSNEYMYVSVDEFKEKIQPHFVDICMQE